VHYTAIAGVWHPGWFDFSLWHLLTFIVGKGDGIVPRSSVHSLPYTQNFSFETYGNNDGALHTHLTSQFFVYAMCTGLLGVQPPVLFPQLPHIGPFEDPGTELPGVRKLGTRFGTLHAGETTVDTISVDEDKPVAFSLIFPSTDEVSLSVVSPSGVRWDKSSVYPDGAGYLLEDYAGQPMASINFNHPELGTWKVQVTADAIDVNPGSGLRNQPATASLASRTEALQASSVSETNFVLKLWMDEPSKQLSVELERESVHVGENFRVKATLTNDDLPLIGVPVTGEAAFPDGTLLPLVLHDDGTGGDQTANDGVYTADFAANAGGEYDVVVNANENRPAALTFSRQESAAGAAATSTTHVEAPFSDRAYSNTGFYPLDTLAVTGTLTADAPGHYHLLGTLRATDGTVVATASRTIDVPFPSSQTMVFNFPGPAINFSQRSGPYRFGARVVEDINDAMAVTQDDPNLYTTGQYFSDSFTPPDEGARTETTLRQRA
jgi:hypothetical protein